MEAGSKNDTKVYEINIRFLSEFLNRNKEALSAFEGVKLLPEIMLVGLISAYDSFLSALLKTVFYRKPEVLSSSQKTINMSDLFKYSSIDNAKESLIDSEIESVIRKSHHEQFDWMQKHFNIKLRENLPIWPTFIELCERRNLFTHTGGVVSEQYLTNCAAHKCTIKDVKIGQKLRADNHYFLSAVEAVSEIGTKLCYVLWRKFDPDNAEKADTVFNARCMDLIKDDSYKLAQSLLSFSHNMPKIKDEIRRMMIVNLANSVLLQGNRDEARQIIFKEDWSATSDKFRLCVAVASSDIDEFLRLMDSVGEQFSAEEYRNWPIFKSVTNNSKFIKRFEDIFKEPFIFTQNTEQKMADAEAAS